MNTKKYLPMHVGVRLLAVLAFFIASTTAAHAATFTVTNTNDSGAGSLRQAVDDANSSLGADTINFDSNVFSTTQTITLNIGLLVIAEDLTINGPGANLLTLSGNNSDHIFYVVAPLVINGMTLADGYGFDGGAIFVNNGTSATVDRCYFRNNQAVFGGAIYSSGASLTISNSSFINNTAENNGGAIYAREFNGNNAYISIYNSTLANNTAMDFVGGAIFVYKDAGSTETVTLELNYTTIAFNIGGGGAVVNENNTNVYSRNTLYGGNINSYTSQPGDFSGAVISLGYNLVSTSEYSSGFSTVNNDILDVDPLIAPVADNGGVTPTVRLLPNSPAIDQANGVIEVLTGGKTGGKTATANGLPTNDQRGMARPVDIGTISNAADGSDIGAFEFAAPTAANVEVAGRVLTATGSGLRNASVTITDQSGATRAVRTSSFGYFRFTDVAVGQTYIVSVNSKQYAVAPQIISVNDQITDLVFTADNTLVSLKRR